MNEKIKQYWEGRAQEFIHVTQATTNDVYLRELEIQTIADMVNELSLPDNGVILDLGCGDGYSTIEVVQRVPLRFVGVDYSENMVSNAQKRLAEKPDLHNRVSFSVGNAIELDAVCADTLYDAVVTDRCLINLESFDLQKVAFTQIANHLKHGGYYIAVENFIEGHNAMNEVRTRMGLEEIPIRWHNLFFHEDEFIKAVKEYFDVVCIKNFSSAYYYATRIIYSAMCKMRGEEPDYEHDIHKLAVNLPWFGNFSPVKMVVLKKK